MSATNPSRNERPAARLLLVGGGGHGRVLLATLQAAGRHVDGILDPQLPRGGSVGGVPVLGDDGELERTNPADVALVLGIGASRNTLKRQAFVARWAQRGFAFAAVVHPAASIAADCVLAPGCQILAGAVLQTGVVAGPGAVVNTGAVVDHDCRLGACCFVGPGATLCGEVEVGAGAFVGAGAIVLLGLHLGADAVVGAGTLVRANVSDNLRVAGNPAREI